jgi:hypothetical protein
LAAEVLVEADDIESAPFLQGRLDGTEEAAGRQVHLQDGKILVDGDDTVGNAPEDRLEETAVTLAGGVGDVFLLHQAMLPDRQPGGLEQDLLFHRLGQVVEGAKPDGLHRRLDMGITGHHHHRAGDAEAAEMLQQFDAGMALEHDIAEDQIEFPRCHHLDRLAKRGDGLDRFITSPFQEGAESIAKTGFVVDHQYRGRYDLVLRHGSNPYRPAAGTSSI